MSSLFPCLEYPSYSDEAIKMHTLSKNELKECMQLYIQYVGQEKTLLKFAEIEEVKSLTHGDPTFNREVQNRVLYTVAHTMIHKQWKKCEVCQ